MSPKATDRGQESSLEIYRVNIKADTNRVFDQVIKTYDIECLEAPKQWLRIKDFKHIGNVFKIIPSESVTCFELDTQTTYL